VDWRIFIVVVMFNSQVKIFKIKKKKKKNKTGKIKALQSMVHKLYNQCEP